MIYYYHPVVKQKIRVESNDALKINVQIIIIDLNFFLFIILGVQQLC